MQPGLHCKVERSSLRHRGVKVWVSVADFPQARFWIVSGFADNPPIWTVPSSCATLDPIGAPGSSRDFCSALSCVFSSTPRQKPTGNRVSL